MSLLMLVFTGFGLSMDAFAVSVTNGLCCTGLRKRQALGMAFCFGFFQGLMPVLGFFCGKAFAQYLCAFDHWVALVLLGCIGGSMLLEAFTAQSATERYVLTPKRLFTQSIAVSIDALAVGVSFAALPEVQILPAALLVGAVTFAVSLAGVCAGSRLGQRSGRKARIIGGFILIGIGVKIFAAHVFAAGKIF